MERWRELWVRAENQLNPVPSEIIIKDNKNFLKENAEITQNTSKCKKKVKDMVF